MFLPQSQNPKAPLRLIRVCRWVVLKQMTKSAFGLRSFLLANKIQPIYVLFYFFE